MKGSPVVTNRPSTLPIATSRSYGTVNSPDDNRRGTIAAQELGDEAEGNDASSSSGEVAKAPSSLRARLKYLFPALSIGVRPFRFFFPFFFFSVFVLAPDL